MNHMEAGLLPSPTTGGPRSFLPRWAESAAREGWRGWSPFQVRLTTFYRII